MENRNINDPELEALFKKLARQKKSIINKNALKYKQPSKNKNRIAPQTIVNQRRFLEEYSKRGIVVSSMLRIGLRPAMHYQWLKKYPAYVEAFNLATKRVTEKLEEEAFRRAHDGVEEPVGFYKGQPSAYVRKYSDGLLRELLIAVAPEKYGKGRGGVIVNNSNSNSAEFNGSLDGDAIIPLGKLSLKLRMEIFKELSQLEKGNEVETETMMAMEEELREGIYGSEGEEEEEEQDGEGVVGMEEAALEDEPGSLEEEQQDEEGAEIEDDLPEMREYAEDYDSFNEDEPGIEDTLLESINVNEKDNIGYCGEENRDYRLIERDDYGEEDEED